MSISEMIAQMRAAGASMDAIEIAVRALEAALGAEQAKEAERKAKQAARTRKHRERKGSVTLQPRDGNAPPDPSPDGRPSPPAPPHPTLNPSPTPGSEPSGSADGEAEPAGCEQAGKTGPRAELMRRGPRLIAGMTGRSDVSARQFIGHALAQCHDEAATVLALIEEADRRELSDATTWILAQLRERRDQGREQRSPRQAYQPAPTGQAARLATLYRQRQERNHEAEPDARDFIVIEGDLAGEPDDTGGSGGPGRGPARPPSTDRRPSDPLQRTFLPRADAAAAQAALRRRRAPGS